jgi:hypothetical protein
VTVEESPAGGGPVPHPAPGAPRGTVMRDVAKLAGVSHSYERGRQLARVPAVTAIFCANDRLALGVLRAMHESNRSVPAEGQRGRLRRHAGLRIPRAAPDDRPPGLHRTGSARRRPASPADAGRGPGSADGRVVLAPELVVRASTSAPPGR